MKKNGFIKRLIVLVIVVITSICINSYQDFYNLDKIKNSLSHLTIQIENDIANLLSAEATNLLGSKKLSIKIEPKIFFENGSGRSDTKKSSLPNEKSTSALLNDDSYYVSSINIYSNRPLTLHEHSILRSRLKFFLSQNNLSKEGKEIVFENVVFSINKNLTKNKWVGTLVIVSFAFMLMIFALFLHANLHRKFLKKIILNKKKKDSEVYDCSAVPYGYMSRVTGDSSRMNIKNWRNLINDLRESEKKLGSKNDISALHTNI